ncbi:MAG: RluA family pseudouridine synthase [Acidobacteria bacterium]|nr:RluA family pseudouridine synthase [Acidobacteriota bacterium]
MQVRPSPVLRRPTRAHAASGAADARARRELPIDRGDVGVRVDLVVLRHLAHKPGVSRARIQKWIAAGRVFVNGSPAPKPSWRVAEGDRLQVDAREIRTRARPRAEAMALDVLFEDAHLLAINKPAGLVVHPSYKHASGTLINALLWHAARWPSGDAPALLTRLDKMTSGVVLVAKRREVMAALQREMRALRIEKDYLAVVHGTPSPAKGTIDLALDRDPWDRRKVTVTDRGGQPAMTKYERVATSSRAREDATGTEGSSSCSLVRCRLVTGRMHQIRVHLAHRGWPLVGDPAYGRKDATMDFPRQALHAWRVALTHPVTREPLEIVAPLPDDFRGLLARLGLGEGSWGPGVLRS